jgi:menaquinone-specific isochorismate synthase
MMSTLNKLISMLQTDWQPASQSKTLRRLTIEISDIDPLAWLTWQTTPVKTYFASRQKNLAIASLNCIHTIDHTNTKNITDAIAQATQILNAPSLEDAKFLAQIDFDPNLRTYRFILPAIELTTQNNKTALSINFFASPDDTPHSITEKLTYSLQDIKFTAPDRVAQIPKIIARTDCPDKSTWQDNVANAIQQIAANNIKKIVLARKTGLTLSGPIDPATLLSKLTGPAISAYDFCFQTDPQTAFIGQTPECLYQRQGQTIHTEALAGTSKLQGNLLDSAKDLQEHQYVLDDIQQALAPITENLHQTGQKQIVKIGALQHICATLNATLKPNITDADIIQSLHPTAAVFGFARTNISPLIDKYEPFDRGPYAGPIGWIGQNAAEFAVAIRSAQIDENKLTLITGAGIVNASNPKAEYEEIENKLTRFLEVLK